MSNLSEAVIQNSEPASNFEEAGIRICTGKLPLLPHKRKWRDRGLAEILHGRQLVLRPARVAMTVALAREFERKLRSGAVQSNAELASLTDLTATRITQLMDLNLLAPDIRREVLQLLSVDGREPTSERQVRRLVRELTWDGQREKWKKLRQAMRSQPAN